MPATRRSARHVENVEEHQTRVRLFAQRVDQVAEDGLITPDESQLLDRLSSELLASCRPIHTEAMVIDGGIRVIGSMLNTMSPSTWSMRLITEAANDEARLNALEEAGPRVLVHSEAA